METSASPIKEVVCPVSSLKNSSFGLRSNTRDLLGCNRLNLHHVSQGFACTTFVYMSHTTSLMEQQYSIKPATKHTQCTKQNSRCIKFVLHAVTNLPPLCSPEVHSRQWGFEQRGPLQRLFSSLCHGCWSAEKMPEGETHNTSTFMLLSITSASLTLQQAHYTATSEDRGAIKKNLFFHLVQLD